MAECDVQLSADGVPFLLHDATLTRTALPAPTPVHTTQPSAAHAPLQADPVAGHHPWAVLAPLDAGRWHSAAYAGEPLPTLADVAQFCLAHALCLNLEIKPSPGTDHATGHTVAEHAARLWAHAPLPPLLTSFSPQALAAAQAAAPQLPRGLLLDAWWPGWLGTAQKLGCCALVAHWPLWHASTVATVRAAGLYPLAYTVNDAAMAQQLFALGVAAVITDKVDAGAG
jgi:glycerophosphoryl diester phosphodiesterase